MNFSLPSFSSVQTQMKKKKLKSKYIWYKCHTKQCHCIFPWEISRFLVTFFVSPLLSDTASESNCDDMSWFIGIFLQQSVAKWHSIISSDAKTGEYKTSVWYSVQGKNIFIQHFVIYWKNIFCVKDTLTHYQTTLRATEIFKRSSECWNISLLI